MLIARWTPSTSRASGGRSSAFTSADSSPRTTGFQTPVRPAAPPPPAPPWTRISNEGVAVSADAHYGVVESGGERLVVAEAVKHVVLPEDPIVAGPFRGAALAGIRYEPLYPNVEGAHRVVT